MTTPKTTPKATPKPRAANPYQPIACVSGGNQMCEALRKYGIEWQKWGNAVLGELDALKNPGGVGPPPTDATQPPPPPFRP